jgi:hypothetical protein
MYNSLESDLLEEFFVESRYPNRIRQKNPPMDRDDFIIAVYLVVCEHYQAIQKRYRNRCGGFAPVLSEAMANLTNLLGG